MSDLVDNTFNISGPYSKNINSSQPEDADAADRRLLDTFVSGKNRAVTPELAARFLYHYRQNILEYTGWQGEKRFNQHAIFLNALAGTCERPIFFEQLEARLIAGKQPQAYLTHFSRLEAEGLLRCNENVFLQKYDDLRKDLQDTPPGPLRVNIFRAISDLRSLALARGVSLVVQDDMARERSIPNLTSTEYQTLEQVVHYANLDDPRSAPSRLQYFKQTFTNFSRQYLTSEGLHKEGLAKVLAMLGKLAISFDVRASELDSIMDVICRNNKCDLNGKDRLNSVTELGKDKVVNVSPDGLPGELKEILIETGYWDLVRNNLSTITLSSEINSNNGAGGLANPILRWVEIDLKEPGGEPKPLWKILDTLVHEADHVEPAWRARPAIMQNSTIKERHAFATELSFLTAYLTKINNKPDDPKKFDGVLKQIKQSIKTANEILGYAPDDLSADNITLPDAGLCHQRGLTSVRELDLSYYPYNPGPTFLAERSSFDKLTARYPALDKTTADLLWEVAEGKAEMIITVSPDKASTEVILKIKLYRSSGKLELEASRVRQLTKFFSLILASTDLKIDEPYLPLTLFGSYQKQRAIGAPLSYRVSAASLRKELFLTDAIK